MWIDPNGKQNRPNLIRRGRNRLIETCRRNRIINYNRNGQSEYIRTRVSVINNAIKRDLSSRLRNHKNLIPTVNPNNGEASYEGVYPNLLARFSRAIGDIVKNKIKKIIETKRYNTSPVNNNELISSGDFKLSYGLEIDSKISELDKDYSEWAWSSVYGDKTFEEVFNENPEMLEYNSKMLLKPSNLIDTEMKKLIKEGRTTPVSDKVKKQPILINDD